MLSNNKDWQGKRYPVILRTRLVVFEEDEGDFDFTGILGETYDTLGLNPADFVGLAHTISIDGVSPAIGKKLAVAFEQRHTWDATNPVWAESFVAIDDIRLYRKL